MSDMTATRIVRGGTVAVAALVWCIAAWLLLDTSVPALHLSGFDQHRFFTQHQIDRSQSYARGARALWVAGTAATIVALLVLMRRLARPARAVERRRTPRASGRGRA